MTGRLESRRALVTGGGSGINRAIVDRFLEEGATVSVADRDATHRDELEAAGVRFAEVDVADADALATWVAEEVDALGGVDVAVAGAGYELVATATELSVDDWDRHMSVMLRAPFVMFKSVLPAMMEQRSGSLIALGSNLSFAGLPGFTSYVPAKHGVIGLVRVLAIDYAPYGIRANALCPGPTETPLIRRQLVGVPNPEELLAKWEGDTVFNRLGRPEEVAAGAVFLASDESSFVTGSSLMIDGGYTAK